MLRASGRQSSQSDTRESHRFSSSPSPVKKAWNASTRVHVHAPSSASPKRPYSPVISRPNSSQSSKREGMSSISLSKEYMALLNLKNGNDKDLRDALRKIRTLILTEGLPDTSLVI